MQITKKLIETLREKTESGFLACKRALEAANGNIELAIESMKKAGAVLVEKKAHRSTDQGIIVTSKTHDGKKAIMLEINSETDFVARNLAFQTFTQQIAESALHYKIQTIEDLIQMPLKDLNQTVEQARQMLVAKVGENIRLSRIQFIETTNILGVYVHKGQYGCIVELQGGNADLAREIAVNIVANSPENLEALQKSNFYKEPSKTVAQYLKAQNAVIMQYVYFVLGHYS